ITAAPSPLQQGALSADPFVAGAGNHASTGKTLRAYHNAMYAALGPQRWWPARTPFEVIVGAILTQSTAWVNVERAIANLRRERMLTPLALEGVPLPRLARLIRPSGYFRQKAKNLKAFVRFLRREFGGSLARMFRTPTARLREMLLRVRGIGPETADSILLYAGNHPVFVVDAYTRRILLRHGLIQEARFETRNAKGKMENGKRKRGEGAVSTEPRSARLRGPSFQFPFSIFHSPEGRRGVGSSYEEIRALFESNLPRDAKLYNEYHALLVQVGKNYCRPAAPKCEACPLVSFLPSSSGLAR
ncbi:MAG: endonuclease III domain-containing protein, partial [Candidatus Acidiferrales bacterium]